MANTFWLGPTQNFLQTTLNGAITDVVQTIPLVSTTGMQFPGYVVIDRTDSAGVPTPTAREVVSYTGISGNSLTGCTRGADNSTGRVHSDGAVVETVLTTGTFNSLVTITSSVINESGYLRSINSPVSIAIGKFLTANVESIASISHLETKFISIQSVTGVGYTPVFCGPGDYSGPTLAIGGVLTAPRAATLAWVAIVTRYCASTASVAFDFKLRNASIFENATTCPAIAAGGTYISTASINVKNIKTGDTLQADVKSVGIDGFIREISIQAGTI